MVNPVPDWLPREGHPPVRPFALRRARSAVSDSIADPISTAVVPSTPSGTARSTFSADPPQPFDP